MTASEQLGGWLAEIDLADRVHAGRQTNGSIALLLKKKFAVTKLNAQIALKGFTPVSQTTLRSFGIPNDEATRTNGPAAAKDITTNSIPNAGTNFSFVCTPLSMSLLTFAPAAPQLETAPAVSTGQFVFRVQGQPSVRYVIQSSSNLVNWVSVSTNTLASGVLSFTNPIVANLPQSYWRAVWQP